MKIYRFILLGILLACSSKNESGSPTPPSGDKKPVTAEKVSEKTSTATITPSNDFKDENKLAGEQFWENSSADLKTGERINTPPQFVELTRNISRSVNSL